MSESPPEGITVRPREAARAPAPPRPVPSPDARRAHLQVVINEEKVADVQGVIAGPGACRCAAPAHRLSPATRCKLSC